MKQLTFLLLLFCLVSCVENEPMLLDEYKSSSEYIIRERPADNPWIPYIPKSTSIETRTGRGALALRDFLGYSLNPQITPIENTLNLGYPVIDKDKLSKSHSSYFTYWKNASHKTMYILTRILMIIYQKRNLLIKLHMGVSLSFWEYIWVINIQ